MGIITVGGTSAIHKEYGHGKVIGIRYEYLVIKFSLLGETIKYIHYSLLKNGKSTLKWLYYNYFKDKIVEENETKYLLNFFKSNEDLSEANVKKSSSNISNANNHLWKNGRRNMNTSNKKAYYGFRYFG